MGFSLTRSLPWRPLLSITLMTCLACGGFVRLASAINIVLSYNNASSVPPTADPTGARLTTMFQHAESIYQEIFEDIHTLTINYWWEDLDPIDPDYIGLHDLISQSGGRETVANIRIDNDRSWFFDPTPADDSEFNMTQTLWRDLSAIQQADFYNDYGTSNIPDTFEVGYRGLAPTGSAADGLLDLVSTVIHEVGHSLGMSSANDSTIAETMDNDYDFDTSYVYGQTLAVESVPGSIGHIDDDFALMCTGCADTGLRRRPSHTDLFAMAATHSYNNPDVLRREWYAGTSSWNAAGNWSGNNVPDSDTRDDVFVRDNGSASTITARLFDTGYAANLFVGEGANVATNDETLFVLDTATVDGEDSDIIVDVGGELDANHVLIQNEAEVFLNGGLVDANALTIESDAFLTKGTGGTATVNVQNILNNEGTIQGGGDETLVFASSGGAVWDLDGLRLGNGIVRAQLGDVNFVSGSVADEFDGDMFIGDGFANARTLTIAEPWTLGPRGVIQMEGESLANRAALNGGTMTSSSGTLDAIAGENHVNAPVILSGSFTANVADGAALEFNGTIKVAGGDFLAVGTGSVEFDGFTSYDGGTVGFTGTLHQDGNATVTSATIVQGDIYNFDGAGGLLHTWTLNNDLTLNVSEIDDVGESFDSTLNINGSGTELTVNTPNSWALGGETNITTGTTGTFPSISGSDVDLTGIININGGTRFDATVNMTSTCTVNLATNSSRLSLNGGNLPDTNRIAGAVVNGPAGSTLRATTSSSLEGYGTINSDVDFTPSTSLLADDGTLQINGAFVELGTIGTADTDATLEVTNPWNTGTAVELQLNGGQVQGATITNDGTTTGFGTIASSNFVNNNTLSANGGTLTLATTTFPDLDGSSEVGVINALAGDVHVSTATGIFPFNGGLNIGSAREFRMNDAGLRNATGGTVTMTGGNLIVVSFAQDATLNVNAGGASRIKAATIDFRAGGVNTVNADLLLQGAARLFAGAAFAGTSPLVVDPMANLLIEDGHSSQVRLRNLGTTAVGFSTGVATIGAWEQGQGATYEVEIDGTTAGAQYDQLIVLGGASLVGTIDILLNQNGGVYADPAVPGTVDKFLLLIAGSITGTFDEVIYDGVTLLPEFGAAVDGDFADHVGAGLFRLVDYGPSNMRFLNYQALPGDANGDGSVDGSDFGIWNANKFLAGTDWTTGDFNGDGTTDGSDFGVWNANKFTSISLARMGGLAFSAVPEPACICLLLPVLWTVARRR